MAAVENWEQGRTLPTWSGVVALAGVLGVSLDEFLVAPEVKKKGRGRPKKVARNDATPDHVAGVASENEVAPSPPD